MTKRHPHDFLRQHTALLRASYLHWTGLHLIAANLDDNEAVEVLLSAPFGVVSHGTEADPIFNYAYRRALELFEMDRDSFIRLTSCLSAVSVNQEKRGKALHEVSQQGYVQHYSGIRIARSGRRFWIRDTTIWNVVSPAGMFMGQAALIGRTEAL